MVVGQITRSGSSYDDGYVVPPGVFGSGWNKIKVRAFAEDLNKALVNEEYNNTTWWSSRYGKTIARNVGGIRIISTGAKICSCCLYHLTLADISSLKELAIIPESYIRCIKY